MQEYLKNHEMPEFENSVRVIRRILSENTDVILIVVGMLNNAAAEEDEIKEVIDKLIW